MTCPLMQPDVCSGPEKHTGDPTDESRQYSIYFSCEVLVLFYSCVLTDEANYNNLYFTLVTNKQKKWRNFGLCGCSVLLGRPVLTQDVRIVWRFLRPTTPTWLPSSLLSELVLKVKEGAHIGIPQTKDDDPRIIVGLNTSHYIESYINHLVKRPSSIDLWNSFQEGGEFQPSLSLSCCPMPLGLLISTTKVWN